MEFEYKEPSRAEEVLKQSLKESDPQKKEDMARHGFSCLRSTYEAFVICTLLDETVVRFDRQIKHKNVGKIYCPIDIGKKVSEKLEMCSGFVDAHLAATHYQGQTPSPERLKFEIEEFKAIREDWKKRKAAEFV